MPPRFLRALHDTLVERIRVVLTALRLHNKGLREPRGFGSLIGISDDFEFRGFPASSAFRNAKRPHARLFTSKSHNKVNRRWIVGKPHICLGGLGISCARM